MPFIQKHDDLEHFSGKMKQGMDLLKYMLIILCLTPAVMFLWPSMILSGPAALILMATIPIAILVSNAGKFLTLWMSFIRF